MSANTPVNTTAGASTASFWSLEGLEAAVIDTFGMAVKGITDAQSYIREGLLNFCPYEFNIGPIAVELAERTVETPVGEVAYGTILGAAAPSALPVIKELFCAGWRGISNLSRYRTNTKTKATAKSKTTLAERKAVFQNRANALKARGDAKLDRVNKPMTCTGKLLSTGAYLLTALSPLTILPQIAGLTATAGGVLGTAIPVALPVVLGLSAAAVGVRCLVNYYDAYAERAQGNAILKEAEYFQGKAHKVQHEIDLEEHVEHYRGAWTTAEEQLAAAQADIRTKAETITTVTRERNEARTQVGTLQAEARQHEIALKEATDKVTSVETEIQHVNEQMDLAKANEEAAKKQSQADEMARTLMNERIQTLEKAKTSLESKFTQAKSLKNQAEAKLAEVRKTLESKEREIQCLQKLAENMSTKPTNVNVLSQVAVSGTTFTSNVESSLNEDEFHDALEMQNQDNHLTITQ